MVDTIIDIAPVLLSDVLLKLGATNEYQGHVSTVQFDPTTSIVNWKGLTPSSVFSFPTSATWTCTLTYAQDWETEDSLSQYLFEHQGEVIAATFEPVVGGATWTASLIIVPGSIGGNVDEVATATVQLGVQGAPALGA